MKHTVIPPIEAPSSSLPWHSSQNKIPTLDIIDLAVKNNHHHRYLEDINQVVIPNPKTCVAKRIKNRYNKETRNRSEEKCICGIICGLNGVARWAGEDQRRAMSVRNLWP